MASLTLAGPCRGEGPFIAGTVWSCYEVVDSGEAVAYRKRFRARVGIVEIAADGTVTYTTAARRSVKAIDPVLAETLHPDAVAAERFHRLAALCAS